MPQPSLAPRNPKLSSAERRADIFLSADFIGRGRRSLVQFQPPQTSGESGRTGALRAPGDSCSTQVQRARVISGSFGTGTVTRVRKSSPRARHKIQSVSALGIPGTKTEVHLDVRQPKNPFWPALKAGSQHPDPTVRLANRLGLLGVWLGLVGVVGSLAPFVAAIREAASGNYQDLYLTGVSLFLVFMAGAVCLWGARGVRRLGNSA